MRQRGRERGINFNRGNMSSSLEKRQGERAQARPDLEHIVARLHARLAHNFAHGTGVGHKVLPQSFGRANAEPIRELTDVRGSKQRDLRVFHRPQV